MKHFAPILALALLSAGAAQADIPAKAFYFGVRGGGNIVLDDWDLSPVGNGKVGPTTGGLVGGHLGFQFNPWVALELGVDWLPTTHSETDESNSVLSYRGDILISLMRGDWVPYVDVGGGAYHAISGDLSEDIDFHLHYGLGLRGMLADWLALRIDVRHMTTDGYNGEAGNIASNLEVTAGLDFYLWRESHAPEIPDTDKDGILDPQDACPRAAGPAATQGCPDSDGDGIIDDRDKCPQRKGTAALDGCPDTDGDSITDALDKCPAKPGPRATGGCPDSDGDGIVDSLDKCPTQAGPAKTNGCPDSDGDGIVDHEDRCPTQAGIPEEQGCLPKEVAEKFSGAFEGIYFSAGSAKIRSKSFKVLKTAAVLLKKWPSVRVRIEGHTDDRGNDKKNLKLSQARAASVKAWLVEQGIAPNRMVSVGFGEKKPIADNKKKDGRAKNRRIEFQIIQ